MFPVNAKSCFSRLNQLFAEPVASHRATRQAPNEVDSGRDRGSQYYAPIKARRWILMPNTDFLRSASASSIKSAASRTGLSHSICVCSILRDRRLQPIHHVSAPKRPINSLMMAS
jgi:hypothetical protein